MGNYNGKMSKRKCSPPFFFAVRTTGLHDCQCPCIGLAHSPFQVQIPWEENMHREDSTYDLRLFVQTAAVFPLHVRSFLSAFESERARVASLSGVLLSLSNLIVPF